MPLLNFQLRFVESIRLGVKAHTIRATQKIPIKVGDPLYLYCQGAYRILPGPVTCTKVESIYLEDVNETDYFVTIDGEVIRGDEREHLAVADGFANFAEMMKFWDGHLPFVGQIIHWRDHSLALTGVRMKVCSQCGQAIPQAEGRRICSRCNRPIRKRERWRFGADGRPRHNDCTSTEGTPTATQQTELLP